MIELQNICKSYDYPVLKAINITFNKGITGIMGYSGSGKTTLLSSSQELKNVMMES